MADAAKMAAAIGFVQKLIDAGALTPRVTYVDVAACALFVWDYFLTFGLEVQHIWKSRWNVIKVVFLLQRYLPFFDSCYLVLYRQLAYNLTAKECRNLPIISGLVSIVGVALSEVLLGFRVYAVWSRNKYIAMSLVIIGAGLTGCMLAGAYKYADSLGFLDFDLSKVGIKKAGCTVISAGESNTMVMIWTALMAWNTVTMILMLIPGYTVYRSGASSELWSVLYKDVLSILNIIFATSLRPALRIAVTVLEPRLRFRSARADTHSVSLRQLDRNLHTGNNGQSATRSCAMSKGVKAQAALTLGSTYSRPTPAPKRKRAMATTSRSSAPRKRYIVDDAKATSSESPIRLGRRPPSKPAQETPLSTGPGHSGGATIPPPRIAVAHDPVMRLDIYPVQKQPGTSHQVVDSPQTPKRDRRSEGRMAIACATPQLSSNDAMASMRELYASPEQPPTPSDPTRETESVGNSDSDEDEEAEEEVQFNTPRRSFFKAPCATPTRAVNGGSWFSPARPGRNA
ncbi:hypothetical protein D9619_008525 [Psilocybe cf. subviscida]|uniref:DUF6533 domain-containing protein n=1 Tax=Psilocybe cf. subviscida TaxID=2480587 RepID=A0A8H5B9Z1_9AGAR|nr:hypothetical protein D9619_008525 [Psilocybe cf. subviscida]